MSLSALQKAKREKEDAQLADKLKKTKNAQANDKQSVEELR